MRYCVLPLLALILLTLPTMSQAEPVPEPVVREAMIRVEALLLQHGISVQGYSQTGAPVVETVPGTHMYLQGQDGAFVAGRIYISADAISACRSLTLVHEIVHDASMKYRLFAGVPDHNVRDMFEALADTITEAAATDPWRPGCLPHRKSGISRSELASLALR